MFTSSDACLLQCFTFASTGTDCFHHPLFQRGKRELASKIICTPRADVPPGANGVPGLSGGGKDQAKFMGMGASADSKPPSLAGVEKFIRAKVAAEAAKNKQKAAMPTPKPPKEGGDSDASADNLDLNDNDHMD